LVALFRITNLEGDDSKNGIEGAKQTHIGKEEASRRSKITIK